MNAVDVTRGNSPIILGQPHSGTFIPDAIYAKLNQTGRELLDTDWHVPRLYDGLMEDVTVVRANFSRYVIDPNRSPQNKNLYPGQNSTELVPLCTFDGEPIWQCAPDSTDIEYRLQHYHQVYHRALEDEIARLKQLHEHVVLYDCHSIRSQIEFLFDGQLPDLNVGDNSGESCNADITDAVAQVCRQANGLSHVINGRFRGGWTTRHYGRPEDGVHAIQMELAQSAYLQHEAPPFAYDEQKASKLRRVLSEALHGICATLSKPHFGE